MRVFLSATSEPQELADSCPRSPPLLVSRRCGSSSRPVRGYFVGDCKLKPEAQSFRAKIELGPATFAPKSALNHSRAEPLSRRLRCLRTAAFDPLQF